MSSPQMNVDLVALKELLDKTLNALSLASQKDQNGVLEALKQDEVITDDGMKNKIEELEKELEEKNATIKSLEDQMFEENYLSNELNIILQEKQYYKELFNKSKKEEQNLQEQIKQSGISYFEVYKKMRSLEKTLKYVQEENDHLKITNSLFEVDLEHSKEKISELQNIAGFDVKDYFHMERIYDLKKDLKELEKQTPSAKDFKRLQEENENLKRKLKNGEIENRIMCSKLDVANEYCEELKEQCTAAGNMEMRKKIMEMVLINETLEQDLKEMKKKNIILEVEVLREQEINKKTSDLIPSVEHRLKNMNLKSTMEDDWCDIEKCSKILA